MIVDIHRKARRGRSKPLLQSALSIAFYVALVLVFTWPLVKEPGSHIPGMDSDAYVHLWTFDWVGQAITSGDFSLYTNRLFYPGGVSLLNHNVAWFNIVVWMLLKPFFGTVAAYTLTVLVLLALNGYAIHLLVRDLTGSEEAAFLAGVIATTWPFINTRLDHPNLIVIGFIPLAMRHIRRLILERRGRDVLLSGLYVGLIGVVRFQLLAMSAVLIGPFALYLLIASKQLKNLKLLGQLALAVIIACTILAPFVVPVLVYQLSRAYPSDLFVDSSVGGLSDPVYYFLPSGFHPLWGQPLREALENTRFRAPFHVPFVGYTVLLLSIVGVVTRPKQGVMWGLLTIIIAILALGPVLVIGEGRVMTLPYVEVYRRFVAPVLRHPDRFNVLMVIPFSVLAALGGLHLWGRRKSIVRKSLCTLAAGLVLFEFAMWPFPSLPLWAPAWYTVLSQEEGEFGIVEIPMNQQDEEQYMMYQLTHRKPMVEGRVSRPPREASSFIASVPLLNYLDWHDSRLPPYEDTNISEQLDALHRANLRYLILHRKLLTEAQIATWRQWLVISPYHEDDDVIVYRTDPAQLTRVADGAPQVSGGVQLVQAQLVPSQTIQAGWVQILVHWFVSHALDVAENEICIALLDGGGVPVHETCGLRVMNVPEGDAVPPGMLSTVYLVQVAPSVDEGEYQVVFFHPAAEWDSLADTAVYAGDLTVSALPHSFDPPAPDNPVDVAFGDEIRLVGYDAEQTKDALLLTLYWNALAQPSESYKIFVHLTDVSSGEIVAQEDHVPCDWQYPTHLWQAGEYVHDRVMLELSGVPPGRYQIRVGIYHPESGQRLETVPALPDHAVLLMEIERE
jgi:hypothetical protein